jgi:hypothetical protein
MSKQAIDSHARFQPQSVWREPLDAFTDRVPHFGAEQVGAGEYDHVSARQVRERLAEQAAGQQSFAAERVEAVEQHDVEVAMEAAMLEGVVEQDELRAMLVDRLLGGGMAIAVLEMGNIRQSER